MIVTFIRFSRYDIDHEKNRPGVTRVEPADCNTLARTVGDHRCHESRVVTTMSVRDFDPHAPSDVAPTEHHRPHRKATAQRYAAVVAALIDVRPDEATARFDDELAKALTEHRIDDETARTLRWWQRASVRAAETYAETVLPRVFAIRDEAEAHAKAEADEVAASWAAAQIVKAGPGAKAPHEAAEQSHDLGVAGRGTIPPSRDTTPISRDTPAPIAELAAVPTLSAVRPDSEHVEKTEATRIARPTAVHHTTDETRRAVRAAFALVATDPHPATPSPDLAATVVTMVPTKGKDPRRDADPATSA